MEEFFNCEQISHLDLGERLRKLMNLPRKDLSFQQLKGIQFLMQRLLCAESG
jgi:hypothetical protein